ncbi:MAG: lipoyl synthase [Myxococcales bacterium]|nr:lipoyl synthase [Myxococcales bacterium]MCB9644171.1 lipoyl synthase [Myxococcales bacterium]
MTQIEKKTIDIRTERSRRKEILRKPSWLRSQIPAGENFSELKDILRSRGLYTVCEEARCPNLGECWSGGTATFMVMGDVCTRGCRFCAVKTAKQGITLDVDEPRKVAESATAMKLDYVVITSVDRDDLPDGGAAHFAEVIREVYVQSQDRIMVEVLTPDFQGDLTAVETIAYAKPTVFAHNLETVRRLTKGVRDPRSQYDQSLRVLEHAKKVQPQIVTKSALMLGLGEQDDEVFQAMDDLLAVGVEILTLGQYLQPTKKHIAVESFVTPEKFDAFAEEGRKRGFAFVAAGPMVRSSYRAGELFIQHLVRERQAKAAQA